MLYSTICLFFAATLFIWMQKKVIQNHLNADKMTFPASNVSNPFQMAQRRQSLVRISPSLCWAASGRPACLNSVRMRAVMHNTKTMTRPLPFNYSEEGCLDKITKPAEAVFLAFFSVYILGVFLATLACTLLLRYFIMYYFSEKIHIFMEKQSK